MPGGGGGNPLKSQPWVLEKECQKKQEIISSRERSLCLLHIWNVFLGGTTTFSSRAYSLSFTKLKNESGSGRAEDTHAGGRIKATFRSRGSPI